MNAKHILFGGFLATLVIVAVQWVTWGVILADAMAAAHADLDDASWTPALLLGTTVVNGLMIAWLYGAILPRFGPGG